MLISSGNVATMVALICYSILMVASSFFFGSPSPGPVPEQVGK